MKRYPRQHVIDALEETERNVFTPHAQIVLAAEVRALRLQVEPDLACTCRAGLEWRQRYPNLVANPGEHFLNCPLARFASSAE